MYEGDKSKLYVRDKKDNVSYKRLLLSLSFLCIITLMPIARRSMFAVRDIEVIGNKNIDTESIVSVIEHHIGANLLAVKPGEIKHEIQEIIPIETVNVGYKLPHTLVLRVKEREISAALNHLNGFVLIDSEGFVVKTVSKLESYSIPVITGLNTIDAKIAKWPKFEENTVYFEELLELIKSLKPILPELSEINLAIDEVYEVVFYLYTLDGYQMLLDKWDDEKTIILQKLLVDLRKKNIGTGLLDLRCSTPVFEPFDIEIGEEKE